MAELLESLAALDHPSTHCTIHVVTNDCTRHNSPNVVRHFDS